MSFCDIFQMQISKFADIKPANNVGRLYFKIKDLVASLTSLCNCDKVESFYLEMDQKNVFCFL